MHTQIFNVLSNTINIRLSIVEIFCLMVRLDGIELEMTTSEILGCTCSRKDGRN